MTFIPFCIRAQPATPPPGADVEAIHRRVARAQSLRRLILAVLSLMAVSGLLWVGSAWPDDGWVNAGLEWVGLFMIIVAIAGRCACILYLGGHKGSSLTTTGPYSLCRNPLYLFSLLAVFGIGLQTASVLAALILTVVAFGVFRWLIAEEEALLQAAFGDAFRDYRARVPRLWPRLSGWRSPSHITVDVSALWKTICDASLFFLAIPLFEAIGYLQQIGWLHIHLWLP